MATGRDLHIDVPLTNVAIEAFQGAGDITYAADALFPAVPVGKQSDKYYTIDKAAWLRNYDSLRARKATPRPIEFSVSSDSYFCDNHALREDNALEDLDNADVAIALRQRSTNNVVEAIRRSKEIRVAKTVTSISNVGSGVRNATAGTLWSQVTSADIQGQVSSAHAFIQHNTGLRGNVAIVDYNSYEQARRNTRLLDFFRYARPGSLLTGDELATVFGVQRVVIADGVYNANGPSSTASMQPMWGANFVLAHVAPGQSIRTRSFGLTFTWRRPGFPGPIYTRRYADADPGRQVEWVEAGFYHDEKIVAPDLCYVINTTSGS